MYMTTPFAQYTYFMMIYSMLLTTSYISNVVKVPDSDCAHEHVLCPVYLYTNTAIGRVLVVFAAFQFLKVGLLIINGALSELNIGTFFFIFLRL